MDRTELAWAAGFFDAEGWAATSHRSVQARINQADPDRVPEVLERFLAAVGSGRIGGPELMPDRLPLYHWVASSRPDVERVIQSLEPWLCGVKREQFELALASTTSPSGTPTDEELRAWAAGLFDGDGSTYFEKHRTHPGYLRAEAAITQASRTGPPEVLVRFVDIVGGVGRVYGPYGGDENSEPVYRYKAQRVAYVEQIIGTIWPWLGSIKRVQAMSVIATVKAQPVLPRGNPAWGNRKTHCVNGHEYESARIRPFRSRKGGTERRASKQCLACVRDSARCWRERKKSSTA